MGIFGLQRDEVTGKWRKLHNEELHDLYCSPSIARVIKSGRMRWVKHVARMGRVKVYTGMGGTCSTFGESKGVYRDGWDM
jgi:hypothetical protein